MPRKRRGREEGSIFQRADGYWTASISAGYDSHGKRRRKTVYGTTKKEVQDKLRELQAKGPAAFVHKARLTVEQYLTGWLETKQPTVAAYTYRDYKRDCDRYLVPHIGGVKLVEVTAFHVEKLYADLAADGVSAAMIRKAGTTLRAALQHGVHPLKLIPFNPAAGVKKPRHQPKEMQVLDPDQVTKFLAEAKKDRLYVLYAVALDSGAREGELFALTWNDVDFEGKAVSITKALEETKDSLTVKEVKTKKSRRRIVLSAFAVAALGEHRKAMLAEGNYRAEAPVFCDTRGRWLRKSNVLRRSFRPILKRAGLPPIRPYDLRHSSATLLLLAGEDSKVVAERLGHSTTRLTQDTYQHVLPGMQERAASKLDAIFRQPSKQEKNASG